MTLTLKVYYMNTYTLIQLNMILDEYHWICRQFGAYSNCAPIEAMRYLHNYNLTLFDVFRQLKSYYSKG